MSVKSRKINFKIALVKNGFSIVELAKRLEIDQSYTNLIVNGKRNPSPKLAKRIADTLGVEIEEIFTIESKKEAN